MRALVEIKREIWDRIQDSSSMSEIKAWTLMLELADHLETLENQARETLKSHIGSGAPES